MDYIIAPNFQPELEETHVLFSYLDELTRCLLCYNAGISTCIALTGSIPTDLERVAAVAKVRDRVAQELVSRGVLK